MSENLNEKKQRLPVGLLVLLFLGLVAIPGGWYTGITSIETVNMLGRYMCFAIVAIGLDLVWGYSGVLSLCQALFFSLGGYAFGMFCAHHGGPEGLIDATGWKLPACFFVVYPYQVGEGPTDALLPWFWKLSWYLPVAVLLGLVIPGLVGFVIGFFGFRSRVRGVYFAILTQAITVAAWNFFCMNNMKFCGTNGLTRFKYICTTMHPPGTKCAEYAPWDLSEPNVQMTLYLATLFCLAGVYWLSIAITRSRLGRVLIAIRDDENTICFSGYDPANYKIFIYVVAAMIGGLGGVLYAPQMKIFTPEYMTAKWSILVVIWVAVGGRGSLSGAVLGALGVNLVYNFLTSRAAETWPFIQGLMFILVVLLWPDGLMGILNRLRLRGIEFKLRFKF